MIINIKSGMKKRVTKQKQIILETIRKDRSHPTMADIYKKVQNKIYIAFRYLSFMTLVL